MQGSTITTEDAYRVGDLALQQEPTPTPIAQKGTAIERLVKVLATYQSSCSGLQEFEGRLSRAELDEAKALDDENDDGVERAQTAISVAKAKIANKQTQLAQQLKDLERANTDAKSELNRIVSEVSSARRAVMIGRGVKALQLPQDAVSRGFFLDLLEMSAPIEQIERLHLYGETVGASGEQIVTTAKQILSHYDVVMKERQREI